MRSVSTFAGWLDGMSLQLIDRMKLYTSCLFNRNTLFPLYFQIFSEGMILRVKEV